MNNKFNSNFTGDAGKLSTFSKISNTITANSIANPATNLIFSLIFAALMAISANSFIYLPFTPVPVTTQVFTVLASGLLLGSRWAFISQASYIIIGLCGLPVFSGFKNGMVALPGPTGGYIIGFMAAAFVTGYIYENSLKKCPEHTGRLSRTFASYAACIASCTAGVMIIHFFGFIHLFGYFYSTNINLTVLETLVRTWKLGTWPFLLIDFLKATVAVIIINPVKSKK